MDDKLDPKLLDSVDESKRSSLRKLILGSAFAVPIIASFTMSGLGTAEAGTHTSNQTGGCRSGNQSYWHNQNPKITHNTLRKH